MTNKLRNKFNSSREARVSEPIFTAQIVKDGYVCLNFNRRHKRGTRQFLWLPWEVPAGVSDIAKSKLEKLFELCKSECGKIIRFDSRCIIYDNGAEAGDERYEYASPLRYGDKIAFYEDKIHFINYLEQFPRPKYYRD